MLDFKLFGSCNEKPHTVSVILLRIYVARHQKFPDAVFQVPFPLPFYILEVEPLRGREKEL